MTGREGRLTIQGDRAVLTFERRLPYPIEAVWSAITDPGERAQWFGETTVDAREGGLIDMVATGPPLPTEKKRMTGRILVWDPPRVLEHEWKQAIVRQRRAVRTASRRRRDIASIQPSRTRRPKCDRLPGRNPRLPGPAGGISGGR